MGIVIQFPIGGDIEFRRTVRAVEAVILGMLANGPQLVHKVQRALEKITMNAGYYREARFNLGIRQVEDSVNGRLYWAMPGDEEKVPNATQYSYLERREG
jgi:hypothetical protein